MATKCWKTKGIGQRCASHSRQWPTVCKATRDRLAFVAYLKCMPNAFHRASLSTQFTHCCRSVSAGQRASTAVPLTPPSHLSADARRIIRAVALRSSTSASTSNASAPAVSAAAGNGAQRPFLPQIDPQAVLSTLFDDKPALEGTLSSFIATDGALTPELVNRLHPMRSDVPST